MLTCRIARTHKLDALFSSNGACERGVSVCPRMLRMLSALLVSTSSDHVMLLALRLLNCQLPPTSTAALLSNNRGKVADL
eukprot:6212753-Pleurochrysis_carterae.AAC.1